MTQDKHSDLELLKLAAKPAGLQYDSEASKPHPRVDYVRAAAAMGEAT